jgi:hypothetical protein
MSVQGPSSHPLRPIPPSALPAPGAARATVAAAARPAAQPPAESSLWDLLTDEERGFFSQQASLGALSYGRSRGAAPAAQTGTAPIGQRLDVRG